MTDLTVVAFDPGQTTGWAAMTVSDKCLLGQCNYSSPSNGTVSPLHECVKHGVGWQWGQIDSAALGSTRAGEAVGRGHDALNFIGENIAVAKMLSLTCQTWPNSAVALEKFVLDPKAASGKFDLLSPVRIISAFSFGLHVEWADKDGMDEFHNPQRDPYNRFFLINRGDPKRTCTNERMKRWGFGDVVKHERRHACDASRIAFYFLRDCVGTSENVREKRWRAWPQHFEDPQVRRPVRKPKPALGERI